MYYLVIEMNKACEIFKNDRTNLKQWCFVCRCGYWGNY